MSLEDRFAELPDDVKEKAKACESLEEVMQLAKDSMIDLSDEEVEAISGGWSGGGCEKDVCKKLYTS